VTPEQEGVIMVGIVVALYIAPQTHAPMIALPVAHLVPGKGIEGDRYYTNPKLPRSGGKVPYEITLVEQEALDAFHATQPEITPDPSGRRNLIIRACSVQSLAGCIFRIGEVVLRGAALREFSCDSSAHTQHTVCNALHQQWLGACILTEGRIYPGDQVETLSTVFERSFPIENRTAFHPL
jgi:MOSC domain-containing protein YiiM